MNYKEVNHNIILYEDLEYTPQNTKINTKDYGEIDRKVYKNAVEILALFKIIKDKIKENNLPYSVKIENNDKGFFETLKERIINKKYKERYTNKEQDIFECIKEMNIFNAVDMTNSILCR